MEKNLIVGLGNPDKSLLNTKHNIGRLWVENICTQNSLNLQEESKFDSIMAATGEMLFCLPQTYMNLSGSAVQKVLSFYQIPHNNLIVVHDDVDLEIGTHKIVFGSSSAGHHGIESIIQNIGTKDFWRLRIGIGRPENSKFDVADYVLSNLTDQELKNISTISLEYVLAEIQKDSNQNFN